MGMKKASIHKFEIESTEHEIIIEVEETRVTVVAVDAVMTHDEFREFSEDISKLFTPIRKSRAKSPANKKSWDGPYVESAPKLTVKSDAQPDTEQVANREFVESVE